MRTPITQKDFELVVRGADKYPLFISFSIGKNYRTEEHMRRVLEALAPYGEFHRPNKPSAADSLFGMIVPDEQKKQRLEEMLFAPENEDILNGFNAISAGSGEPMAASYPSSGALQNKLY